MDLSVITRTKNRPVTLWRALESVAGQTARNFEWIVVNDAGEKGPVEEVAAAARERGVDVRVVHREKSCGMEAASNNGIRESKGRFVTIHDDDDTWDPRFIEVMTGRLSELQGSGFAGVTCGVTKVVERIEDDTITEVSRQPFQSMFRNVSIARVAAGVHSIIPGSFVYTREMYDRLGGYREDLPVLGDWDFHLRFLLEADVWMVPEPLFNYHFRYQDGSIYGNTVTAGLTRHRNYRALLQNEFWRRAFNSENGALLLAVATNLGAPAVMAHQTAERAYGRLVELVDRFNVRKR